jgi:hypothetical protein
MDRRAADLVGLGDVVLHRLRQLRACYANRETALMLPIVLAWSVAVVIAALNAWLLYQTFVGLIAG